MGAVQKALRDKRIHLNGNGKIDSDVADRDWAENTDASRVAMNVLESQTASPVQQSINLDPAPSQTVPAQSPPSSAQPDADEVTGSDRVAGEYREHRSKREQYQALKQQLEYEQLVGTVLNAAEASRIVYTAFRTLRDAVVNVSPRIKDQLAAVTDADAVEAILDRELAAALSSVDVAQLLKERDD